MSKTNPLSKDALAEWLKTTKPNCRRCKQSIARKSKIFANKDDTGFILKGKSDRWSLSWICNCGFENVLDKLGFPLDEEEEAHYHRIKNFYLARANGLLKLFFILFFFGYRNLEKTWLRDLLGVEQAAIVLRDMEAEEASFAEKFYQATPEEQKEMRAEEDLGVDTILSELLEMGVIEWVGPDTVELTKKAQYLLTPGNQLSDSEELERQILLEKLFHPQSEEDST